MSSTEFVSWQAWLRRNPAGWAWENRMFAELKREIASLRPREKGTKLPPLSHYLWKPPEPLFAKRLAREARKTKGQTKET